MKSLSSTLLLLLVVLIASASQNRKVLLIGIDGARSDCFQQANTPNIDALLANSLYTYDSWHTGITFSGPSWSTILTGVEWNKHGVTENGFNGSNFGMYPALPKRAKQIYPNLKCVEVVEWHPLADNFPNNGWDKMIKVPDQATFITADSAIAQLQNPDIDLLFAYFDKVDMTGHYTTFSPTNPLYIKAIEQVDTGVGLILDALYARPTYANENWLVMLITDHGGTSLWHGGNSLEERHIWWIANGSVVPHRKITEQDPGTYNCKMTNQFVDSCVDKTLMRKSPVQADFAVTALHHLIFDAGINPATKQEWSLDGQSWLSGATGISEVEIGNDLSVYPNPGNGVFGMRCFTNCPEFVSVVDAAGRHVKTFGMRAGAGGLSINIEENEPGLYFARFYNGNELVTKKLVLIK